MRESESNRRRAAVSACVRVGMRGHNETSGQAIGGCVGETEARPTRGTLMEANAMRMKGCARDKGVYAEA